MHTVDVIEDLLNELDFTFNVTSITDDGTDTTITVRRTFHARPKLLINGSDIILSVDHENKIIVISGVLVGPFVLQSPFYFHGVPYKVNAKLSDILQTKDKLPMVYLLEILSERRNYDELSNLDRESSIRLFFLDEANYAEWDTDEHYSLAITPMDNLLVEFTDLLQRSGKISETFEDGVAIPHANFGQYVSERGIKGSEGHLNSIFNEHTSGMELSLTLPILKEIDCDNIC